VAGKWRLPVACLLAFVLAASSSALAAAPPARNRLTGVRACPHLKGFSCGKLTVPLDWAGQARGTLRLTVGLQNTKRPPRGVLLFLTGGPGQPGVRFIRGIRRSVGPALSGYRLVMIDQRGTGDGALRCPALQSAEGAADLAVLPRAIVAACARRLGPKRRFFTTAETVRDLDSLRVALGARRLTIDGVSYGTYVAERYALTFPRNVTRLVLDSVVPQQGVEPLLEPVLSSTPRVLRRACAEAHCTTHPLQDLRAVIRKRHDGPQLLNTVVSLTAFSSPLSKLFQALHAARDGDFAALDELTHRVNEATRSSASELSAGLHQSTICMDLANPWNPAAPSSTRAATLARLASRVSQGALIPWGRATAVGNGLTQACLAWPATAEPALSYGDPDANLPRVPVLMLVGQLDLSTPIAWAHIEQAKAPIAKLVVEPGVGHAVQSGPSAVKIRAVLARFLHG
jgi:pimeloyl-ACP methyl ester carboxylesterase